jgi:EAL domain-containing protein (putative c-di-GMP-specific phosphodiesterase class I)
VLGALRHEPPIVSACLYDTRALLFSEYQRDGAVVGSILKWTGLDPGLLQIELTESVMIGSLIQSAEKMMSLRSLGVTVAIDDFGTGYSSLGNLSGLPFSALKIDRTFVRGPESSSEVSTMIRSMTELGQKMGLSVIVEGIEEESQFNAVLEMGADEVQGYLLGRPSPKPRTHFAEYISARRRPLEVEHSG